MEDERAWWLRHDLCQCGFCLIWHQNYLWKLFLKCSFHALSRQKRRQAMDIGYIFKKIWLSTASFIHFFIFVIFCNSMTNGKTASVKWSVDFWKFLAINFITKVAQMIGDFLGSCENHCFLSQTGEATFWQLLEKLGLLFIQHLVTLLKAVSIKKF